MFLESYPFHLGIPISLHVVSVVTSYNHLYFCGISCYLFSFISDFIYLGLFFMSWVNGLSIFKKRFYLFLEKGEGSERKINVWLPLVHTLLGTWPTTQACALTGNRTSDPLVHRVALNPLSHTSQG